MSLSYILNESVSGFTRTKLSSIISMMTIAIALLLLGIFVVVTFNTSRFMDALRQRVELEAFLEEPVSPQEVDSLRATLRSIPGIATVTYVSKDDAARIFKEEFGEDIKAVLGSFNPLPPSFKIGLAPASATAAGTREISARIQALGGIDTVMYRKSLIETIDRRSAEVNAVTLGLGLLVGLSAILLVSNTIRLAIYAKRRIIRTMELVGATSFFIRFPFLLEGTLQGLIGGVAAAGILYLLLTRVLAMLSQEIVDYVQMPPAFYVMVVVAGTALGLLGSVISVTRFIGPARHT